MLIGRAGALQSRAADWDGGSGSARGGGRWRERWCAIAEVPDACSPRASRLGAPLGGSSRLRLRVSVSASVPAGHSLFAVMIDSHSYVCVYNKSPTRKPRALLEAPAVGAVPPIACWREPLANGRWPAAYWLHRQVAELIGWSQVAHCLLFNLDRGIREKEPALPLSWRWRSSRQPPNADLPAAGPAAHLSNCWSCQ